MVDQLVVKVKKSFIAQNIIERYTMCVLVGTNTTTIIDLNQVKGLQVQKIDKPLEDCLDEIQIVYGIIEDRLDGDILRCTDTERMERRIKQLSECSLQASDWCFDAVSIAKWIATGQTEAVSFDPTGNRRCDTSAIFTLIMTLYGGITGMLKYGLYKGIERIALGQVPTLVSKIREQVDKFVDSNWQGPNKAENTSVAISKISSFQIPDGDKRTNSYKNKLGDKIMDHILAVIAGMRNNLKWLSSGFLVDIIMTGDIRNSHNYKEIARTGPKYFSSK